MNFSIDWMGFTRFAIKAQSFYWFGVWVVFNFATKSRSFLFLS